MTLHISLFTLQSIYYGENYNDVVNVLPVVRANTVVLEKFTDSTVNNVVDAAHVMLNLVPTAWSMSVREHLWSLHYGTMVVDFDRSAVYFQ